MFINLEHQCKLAKAHKISQIRSLLYSLLVNHYPVLYHQRNGGLPPISNIRVLHVQSEDSYTKWKQDNIAYKELIDDLWMLLIDDDKLFTVIKLNEELNALGSTRHIFDFRVEPLEPEFTTDDLKFLTDLSNLPPPTT